MTGFRFLGRTIASVAVAAALLTGCAGTDPGDEVSDGDPSSAGASVAEGKELYEETCATCHGSDLKGTTSGPPFLDPIYAPNHHSDEAFYAAAANGVQPHHWQFGPMPAQPSVDTEDVAAIIAFVRSEQKKAGITEDPSHP